MDENKITRIAVQKKNPKRVNIYLDGIYSFSLYRDNAAWLEIGQILSDEKIKKLLEKDQKTEVYTKAVDYIAYKPRTVWETKKRLQSAGYDEILINETVSQLVENGLLNDQEFAAQWVEERQLYKNKSKRVLMYELRQKGIPDNLIQSAVEDIDDFQSAYEVAESRLSRFSGIN